MEAILKDENAHDGHSTAYIGIHPDDYDLYGGSSERRKLS